MTWVGVIYYWKCNYYVLLINCNRHCARAEFIQGGFRLKILKNIGFLNFVVLSISDYIENDGKLGFCQKPENWSHIGDLK